MLAPARREGQASSGFHLKINLGGGDGLAVNGGVATLVFDIETCALPLEHFDEAQQEYLFRE